jgi:hypothetical protein
VIVAIIVGPGLVLEVEVVDSKIAEGAEVIV